MNDKVDVIVAKYAKNRGQLVSVLQDVQAEFNYLPKEALFRVSESMCIPISQVYQVATFFRAFSLKPRGKHTISACLGTACHVRGGVRVVEELERVMHVTRGHTTQDMKFTLETVNCVGACALGPVIKIDETYYGQMTPDKVAGILAKY
jgi:NADH-quinone oxidoreductase subunit E